MIVLGLALGLAYVAAALALALLVGVALGQMSVSRARRQGRYPAKGKATLDDVRRLALAGDVALAMRAYREIRPASLREAKEAVMRMVASGGGVE